MKKLIQSLRTRTILFNGKRVPSPERTLEIIKSCNGKELLKIVNAFDTESMKFILDFLRVSGAMEAEGKESKTYGEFHEDLLTLILHISKTLKNGK